MINNKLIFSQFVRDVNSVTCQFLTFYSNTVEGQNITTTPKWVGVNGIRKIFADTSSALDTISQNSRTAFTNTNWTQTDPAKFENLLDQSYQKFSSRSLTNRNPAASKKSAATIVPLYISNYGAYTKANTLLNTVYQEFSTKIKFSITLVDQAKEYSRTISDNSQSIKDTITNIDTSLKPLSDAFTNLEKDVINQWIDYVIIIFLPIFNTKKFIPFFLIITASSFIKNINLYILKNSKSLSTIAQSTAFWLFTLF